MTQDLNAMYLFAKVVEHGGYSAAARALGLQTSRLSRRVAELEAQLGVRLLQRTTRRITVTEVGQRFYRHCAALAAEAEAAQETIDRTRSTPQGLVRLSCPVGLLHSQVAAILSRYLADHPQVRLQVEATNRRVEVVDEGFDIALRARMPPLEDSDLAIRPLGTTELVLVASPWLFAHHEPPAQADDLARLPTLSMVHTSGLHTWRLQRSDGSTVSVRHLPRLVADDLQTLRQAAVDGIGLTYLPRFVVQADLASGRLQRVLPELSLPQGIVHAVFPSRRGLVPAVRLLIDALARDFESGAG